MTFGAPSTRHFAVLCWMRRFICISAVPGTDRLKTSASVGEFDCAKEWGANDCGPCSRREYFGGGEGKLGTLWAHFWAH
jgi:hypothetical protein